MNENMSYSISEFLVRKYVFIYISTIYLRFHIESFVNDSIALKKLYSNLD